MDVEKQLEWASLLKINKGRTNEKEGSEQLLATKSLSKSRRR